MFNKYKKLYNEAHQKAVEVEKEAARLQVILKALQTDNQRLIDETTTVNKQLIELKAAYEEAKLLIDSKQADIEQLRAINETLNKELAEERRVNDSLRDTLREYETLLNSSTIHPVGECEGCAYKVAKNFQKCASCVRNAKAKDKFKLFEPVIETTELRADEAEAELPECSEGLPVDGAEPIPAEYNVGFGKIVDENSTIVIKEVANEPTPAEETPDIKPTTYAPKKKKNRKKNKR